MSNAEHRVEPFPAAVIADFFLDQAAQAGEFLSPMKLQKLVYIAHGWHLAVTGGPLIRESVAAWQYGPVIESLYHNFKQFGGRPIVDRTAGDTLVGEHLTAYRAAANRLYNDAASGDTRKVLQSVWDRYCRFTAIELSIMTHRKDTPWSEAYAGSTNVRGDRPISEEAIERHFRKLGEQAEAAAT